MLRLSRFKTIVFDCDGVIFDSNSVKTDAFRVAASSWGIKAREAMVAHHVAHGGISRYAKFKYFLDEIAPGLARGEEGLGLEDMLVDFAATVRRGLEACSIAPGLHELREQLPGSRWLVVSGGDQAELRDVFLARGLAQFFDGGVFGSPDEKKAILARELASGNIRMPSVYLGDSKYDLECAADNGLDFVFVSAWSEVADWRYFVAENRLSTVRRLADFLEG